MRQKEADEAALDDFKLCNRPRPKISSFKHFSEKTSHRIRYRDFPFFPDIAIYVTKCMHAPIFPGFKICTSNSLVKQNLPFVHPSPLKFICRQRPSFAHVLGSRVVCKFGRPRISNEAVVWALVFPCFSNHISLRSQRSSECACNHPKCGNDCCISTCQGEMKDCPDGQNSVFSNLQCSRHCLGWSEFS